MKKLFLVWALAIIMPMSAAAGPKEDAFRVVKQFKKAFDASDVQGVVRLFTPDAVFLGTASPKLATNTADIESYFQGLKTDMPRLFTIEDYSTLILSDVAVVFAGLDVFSSTKDGKTIEVPARFTFVITRGDQGWRISHFHSSVRPRS